jgi:hypothetical protein
MTETSESGQAGPIRLAREAFWANAGDILAGARAEQSY